MNGFSQEELDHRRIMGSFTCVIYYYILFFWVGGGGGIATCLPRRLISLLKSFSKLMKKTKIFVIILTIFFIRQVPWGMYCDWLKV